MAGVDKPEKPQSDAAHTPQRKDMFEEAMGDGKKLNGPTGPQQPVVGEKHNLPAARPAGDIATPQAPPKAGEPAKAEAPRPAEAPKPAEVKGAGSDAQPAKPAAAADKPNPQEVLKNVNRILDTEIPALNKAGQTDKAKEAYEKAIKEAEKISKEDIDKAKQDLLEVRKKMLTENNPEEKAKLKQQELDLFTLSRVKDAAYGNMALWYYRQGKVEEGTAKLFQAAGVDEKTAREHSKLTPEDMDVLGKQIPDITKVTIFDDMYFQRQMVKLRDENKIAVPPGYFNVNNYVHAKRVEEDTKALMAPAQATPERPAQPTAAAPAEIPAPGKVATPADAQAVVAGQTGDRAQARPQPDVSKPGDAPAAEIVWDEQKNAATVLEAAKTLDALKKADKLTAISPEQRAAIEAGIKSYQTETAFHDQESQKAMAALTNTLGDKTPSFIDAVDKFQINASNLRDSGKVTDTQIDTLVDFSPAKKAERDAVVNALKASNPDLIAQADAIGAISGDKTAQSLGALRATYDQLAMKNIADKREGVMHVLYGNQLARANDMPAAKAQAEQFFKKLTADEARVMLQGDPANKIPPNEQVVNLAKVTGLDAPQTAPAKPADQAGLLPLGDQSKPLPERVKGMSEDDLQLMILDASKAGGRGLENGKAAFEELIKRYNDPKFLADNKTLLTTNQAALQHDIELREKQAKGEALGPNDHILTKEERTKLHYDNMVAIKNLTDGSDITFQYSQFLGDVPLRQAMQARALDGNKPYVAGSLQASAAETIVGANNQLASMEQQARNAIKLSDSMPFDLINKEAALIKKDKGQVADEKLLNDGLVVLEGGIVTDPSGEKAMRPPLINRGIDQRVQLATIYMGNINANIVDREKTGSTATQAASDPLLKPDKAVALLEEAQNQYANLHKGERLNDPLITRAIEMGKASSPEVFQKLADRAAERYASPKADGVAFVGAILGEAGTIMLAKKLGVSGNIATQIGNVGAVGGAIATRTVAYRAFSGRWDSFENNAIHGGVVGASVVGFRTVQRGIAGSDIASNLMATRAAKLTDQTVATSLVGEGGLGRKFAEQAAMTGRTSEATVAKAIQENPKLFSTPVSQMTKEEVNQMYSALGINVSNRLQRLELMRDVMRANPVGDAARLERVASSAPTVGQFEAQAAARNQRISELTQDLEQTAFKAESRGIMGPIERWRNPDAKVEDVLRSLQKANPEKYPEASIRANLEYLKANGVTSVKDMQGHYLMNSRADIDALLGAAQKEGLLNKSLLNRNPQEADISYIVKKLDGKADPALLARMESRLPSLKRMDVTSVNDLRAAGQKAQALQELEQFSQQFPGIANLTRDTTMQAVVQSEARAFGSTGSARQVELDRILGIKAPKVENSWVNNLYRDRFYNVGDIVNPWVTGARNRFRSAEDALPIPSRRNWGGITENSNLASVDRAVGQANSRAAFAGAAATSLIYRSGTGVYDLAIAKDASGQKRQYEYEPGKFREYSVSDALMESVLSKGNSVGERIVNGGVLSDLLLGGAGFSLARGGFKTELLQWGGFGYMVYAKGSPQDGQQMQQYDQDVANMRAPLRDQNPLDTGLAIDKLGPKPAQPARPASQPQPRPAATPAPARPAATPQPSKLDGVDDFVNKMNGLDTP